MFERAAITVEQPAVTETSPARMPLHMAETSHTLPAEKKRSTVTVTTPPEAAERVVHIAIRPACKRGDDGEGRQIRAK